MAKTILDAIGIVNNIINKNKSKNWLIVGKGPSASHVFGKPVEQDYCVISLNHACKIVSAHVAFFVDIEAISDCAEQFCSANNKIPFLVLPFYPHINFCENKNQHISQHLEQDKKAKKYGGALACAFAQNKLAGYNKSIDFNEVVKTKDLIPAPANAPVLVREFSAVGAFSLLLAAGVRNDIYTVGIDGGNSYSPLFDRKDLLANGRASFDSQFEWIEKLCRYYGVGWKRLFTS